jgi:hypothetical protein
MAAAPVPPVPASSVVPQSALSELARMVDAHIAPSRTFTDLRRNPSCCPLAPNFHLLAAPFRDEQAGRVRTITRNSKVKRSAAMVPVWYLVYKSVGAEMAAAFSSGHVA